MINAKDKAAKDDVKSDRQSGCQNEFIVIPPRINLLKMTHHWQKRKGVAEFVVNQLFSKDYGGSEAANYDGFIGVLPVSHQQADL